MPGTARQLSGQDPGVARTARTEVRKQGSRGTETPDGSPANPARRSAYSSTQFSRRRVQSMFINFVSRGIRSPARRTEKSSTL
jgi:hypothetical protein